MEVVAWIGFSQALFSGLLTLTKGNKSISDRLLSAWLFLLAIDFLTLGLETTIFPHFIILSNSFLLLNPALYLYTCSLTKRNFRLKWQQLLHLLPYVFFKISAWLIEEPQALETFFQRDSTLWFRMFFGTISIASWASYLSLTSIALTRHRRLLKNEFSSIDLFKRLGWIYFIVIFYLLYCFAVFTWGLFNAVAWSGTSLTLFNYSMLLFFVYIFGFYGLKQSDIFKQQVIDDETGSNSKAPTLINAENMLKIETKLLAYFSKEKPYLNPELNMSLLSEDLNIPKHQLTEVLNKKLGKNFFQFVNEYRVEEVKTYLSDPRQNYSIEAIGYECGFNSKSTFFSVFKTLTGLTPKAFQQQATAR